MAKPTFSEDSSNVASELFLDLGKILIFDEGLSSKRLCTGVWVLVTTRVLKGKQMGRSQGSPRDRELDESNQIVQNGLLDAQEQNTLRSKTQDMET